MTEAATEAFLKPATLLKKRLWHWCFPVKFLRTPFFTEHFRTTASENYLDTMNIFSKMKLKRILKKPQILN